MTPSPNAVTIVAPVSHSSNCCNSVRSIAVLTGATIVAASTRSSQLPTQDAATQISGVVTGLVTKVASAASGTFARTETLSSAANRICAKGTMIPTSNPSATPRGTERRVKRHSSERSTRLANGRMKRLRAICSRVGMFLRSQSASHVLERKSIMIPPLTWAAGGKLASGPSARRAPRRAASPSAPLAQQPRLVALPVAVLDGLSLVVGLLALRQGELDLRPPSRVEVDRQRDQRHPLALDRADHLLDLAPMEQQLARPFRLVIETVAVAELGNVRVDQPGLAILHVGVALGDRAAAVAQALHFGAGKRDPGLEHVLDEILEPRAPVLGDGLLLVERRGLGAGHRGGM